MATSKLYETRRVIFHIRKSASRSINFFRLYLARVCPLSLCTQKSRHAHKLAPARIHCFLSYRSPDISSPVGGNQSTSHIINTPSPGLATYLDFGQMGRTHQSLSSLSPSSFPSSFSFYNLLNSALPPRPYKQLARGYRGKYSAEP